MTQRIQPRIIILTGITVLVAAVLLGLSGGVAVAAEEPLQQATATSLPSGFQFPTATATIVGGPTATSTRTPTPVPVLAVTLGDPTTNLRTGPGTNFDIVAELPPTTRLPVRGRWLGYDWLLVAYEDSPTGEAWVYLPLVVVEGDITTVPAVDPPAAPTIDPTVEAALATATILVQTPGGLETATATALLAPTNVLTVTPQPGQQVAGGLPTFTPPPPYEQRDVVPPLRPTGEVSENGGFPPAVLIIGLGVMGVLSLLLGTIRRLF